jgi:hypothetical protein
VKTVVYGLFDDLADARRVLEQLAASPLDMDSVSVLNQDPALQQKLQRDAGLPAGRGLASAVVVGVLAGAVLGAALGSSLLTHLGPVLAAGLGALVGALLAAAAVTLSDSSRLPADLAEQMVAALADGATLVTVRTGNVPTARALRDLFEAAGSRLLAGGQQSSTPAPQPGGPDAEPVYPSARARAAGAPPEPPGGPEEHSLFAPPWRRVPFAARPRGGYPVEEPPAEPAPPEDEPDAGAKADAECDE